MFRLLPEGRTDDRQKPRRWLLRGVTPLLPAFAVVLMLQGILTAQGGAEPKTPPNIILILADDLGYGDLGCYGQQWIQTPEIDRLAREGMRFTQHYAGSTVCAPSRACLLTGRHTGHTRVRGNVKVLLPDATVTVAEVLQQAGYATGLIGKWGVGHPPPPGDPRRNGFEYFYGYLDMWHAHNYYPDFLWRNDSKESISGNVVKSVGRGGVAVKKSQYSHDLFTQDALRFIEAHQEKPFFLYLPFTIPHANNEAGPNGMEVPDDAPYTDRDWPQPQKNHAAMITRLDQSVGRITDLVDRLGIAEQTLILFTSDNGPHKEGGADPASFNSSGGLRGHKRDLYEGGVRVPLIARWPGTVEADSVTDHVSAFWDFLPTAAELAGAEAPEGIDGISYRPTLLGQTEEQEQHDFLYWEFHERGSKQAIRMGQWKLIRFVGRGVELYNLEQDPHERNDLSENHPDVVAKMKSSLEQARRKSELFPLRSRDSQRDERE